ncbi:hypothetical protein [Micromonospora tulbaghiae]|uniref:hypothetical protein n=1 Tax=Micromonospora tulbaghiae TaxID=479978 RepID=UPI0036B0411E
MGRSHPLLRLALFVAVTFGVFGMHTFGHPTGPEAAHASAAHGEDGSPGHGEGMHAFTVCLAVLGGALVLSALSLLCRPRRGTGTPAGPRSRGPGPHRGPPRPPIGLRLRAVTVLRT